MLCFSLLAAVPHSTLGTLIQDFSSFRNVVAVHFVFAILRNAFFLKAIRMFIFRCIFRLSSSIAIVVVAFVGVDVDVVMKVPNCLAVR